LQIILGSDYSGSAKEIWQLLQPGLRKTGLKKSLNRKKKMKTKWPIYHFW